MITATKRFRFCYSHTLDFHKGKCHNIHGHNAVLEVTVSSKFVKQMGDPEHNMVFDFGNLKQLVEENIISRLDHTSLNTSAPLVAHDVINDLKKITQPMNKYVSNVINILTNLERSVACSPTAEGVAELIFIIIQETLPVSVELQHVRLYETDDSWVDVDARHFDRALWCPL